MTRTPLHCLLTSLTVLILGCNRSVVTTFPDGLEPLEDENLAPDPGTASDPYPETVEVVHGETDEYGWAHSRGYVLEDLTTVWEALRNPDVFVDRREADEWDAEEQEDPDYDYVILAHHVVYDLVTVEWWNNWR
ncbi:MAG: hypothetical protein QGG40_14855, partial [Myxococcota bacterium]|nr:hypothetical protein [Myxococcota bacterium]